MRDDRPSATAAWVALFRGLAPYLPPEARLADDPFGARFAGPRASALLARVAAHPRALALLVSLARPLHPLLLWLQVRTRALDDVLLSFVEGGGRQVVLLGAGFDCRAARFAGALGGAVVFEIDHPATQAKKREVLFTAGAESARVEYVSWDFERDAMSELPSRLAATGLHLDNPTLVIWEGVTMYLTPPAIEATLAAVRALAGPGSLLAMTYADRARLARPSSSERLVRAVVSSSGEPFRFGWAPEELPSWLAERGFSLAWDRTAEDLARDLLPPRLAARLEPGRHIAVARRSGR